MYVEGWSLFSRYFDEASFKGEAVTECDVAGCRINCTHVCGATDACALCLHTVETAQLLRSPASLLMSCR